MLLAVALLCLNLLLVQGPVFGRESNPPPYGELMDLHAARQYMVWLINRDRASAGLKPVELDEVACAAGQAHTNDMALSKYISHWDMQGRKPDQRYSEAGGQGAVSENVLITQDFEEHQHYRLSSQQLFTRSELEYMQSLFFKERPPNDGHRLNILRPDHNKVGIGLTRTQPGNRVACAQEFVNQYGSFSSLPQNSFREKAFELSGQLDTGLALHSIDIYRDEMPKPMTRTQLRATHSYNYPSENVARYFPPPHSTVPLKLKRTQQGEAFSLEVKPKNTWKPGLYYVIVWAKKPDGSPIVTSSRTVSVN